MGGPIARLQDSAPVFAALGDTTRLSLLEKLGDGTPRSISRLAEGTTITRQAITKHLRLLEQAGLIAGTKHGRETQFRLRPKQLAAARDALDLVAKQWDDALGRLKSFVEDGPGAETPTDDTPAG